MIMRWQQKWPLIQRNLLLVVYGLTLLHHHIVPPPSSDLFRELREPQNLPTQISLQAYHPILHWKKATSHFFALMAQAWVRTSRWPLFNLKYIAHQSRMGSISLKIEQTRRTFIGSWETSTGPWRRFTFGPLQWSMLRITTTQRWTSILQLFKCSKDNFFFEVGHHTWC